MPSSAENGGAFEWPSNLDQHHGKHIWEAITISTSSAGQDGWLWIAVENVMPSTAAHEEANKPVVSAFDLEVVGAGESAFLPPDEDPVVSELSKTSFRLSWTASQETNATYNVFFHKGHMGTGRMKPGYIMGSACGLEYLGKPAPGLDSGNADDDGEDDDVVTGDDGGSMPHDALRRALMDDTAHHVTRVNDEWSTSLTARVEGLQAGGEYHCDVFVRRPHDDGAVATGDTSDSHDTTHDPQNLPSGFDYRAYHSMIVLTPGSTETGAPPAAAGAAAGTVLVAVALLAVWTVGCGEQ